MVFEGKSGKSFICLAKASSKVSTKKLKNITHEEDVKMASPDEIYEVTGYRVGAIPPFALKSQIEVYIDSPLKNEKEVYVGAGKFGYEIILTPENLKKVTHGSFCQIS